MDAGRVAWATVFQVWCGWHVGVGIVLAITGRQKQLSIQNEEIIPCSVQL
jgi:hypothetical protein